jgi:hypothetical protein
MKTWHKYLTFSLLLIAVAWMALIHEPKTVLPERVLGYVKGPITEGMAPVRLEHGEQISVKAPRQLPKFEGLKVYMEVTDHRWTGKRNYRITHWKSR